MKAPLYLKITKSPQETALLAKDFLEKALKEAKKGNPLIFYLEGELGAGKTHFAKGLAQALGIKDNITSPTFVLMKKFDIPADNMARKLGKKLFIHIDCYRIYDSKDAEQIGLDKVLENPRTIIAIEWAERIADIIPKPYWEIKMEHVSEMERRVIARENKN
ncbi:MAG: tRNA (adenosine(37)-N6)-threonylcarbamoyltransferase complex ATPase subunit type 1 TsaE [Candidatus Spechtbacterales bacterium]